MCWGFLRLVTGCYMASVSTTFRGGGQEDINPSVSSLCLAEPSSPFKHLRGTQEVTPPSASMLRCHLLCETISVGFHVLDLKETLHF